MHVILSTVDIFFFNLQVVMASHSVSKIIFFPFTSETNTERLRINVSPLSLTEIDAQPDYSTHSKPFKPNALFSAYTRAFPSGFRTTL